ncbi:MAG: flagellar protein FliS [Lachnospiraceae bacterium]|nr:flagellar protein FliS [Lachnospiraceae bacterium]MDN4744815.1 flagellar protein FliS [Lachnospiraceae bacterium C1.1]
MTEEKKQDYTLRISQANKTEVVVIIYEVAMDYFDEAMAAETNEDFAESVKKAKKCVEQLRDALDMNYPAISLPLSRLYNFVTLECDKAVMKNDNTNIPACRKVMEGLHGSFSEVAKQDTSGPMMQNAEEVYAGMTYSPTGVNAGVVGAARGFTV